MKASRKPAAKADSAWQKTSYANLVRYVPSGMYFARIRVRGKLIRQSLKTDVLSTAKLRLGDLEKAERLLAENDSEVKAGKMTLGDALKTYLERLEGDGSLKPRTKQYRKECISKLLRTWPAFESLDMRSMSKTACLNWAAQLGRVACPSVFNHTVGTLRRIVEIGVEAGSLYDNPVRFIKRHKERPKQLKLPTHKQFHKFIEAIEGAGIRSCYQAADLVRFLAFGGFRISEAKHITWEDCDLVKKEITVRGDPVTATKNDLVRRVPMIPDMVELLTRLKAEADNFVQTSKVMAIAECQTSMDRAAKLISMPRITHHDLRHLFATRCIESGVDVPTVSRWLGHKDGGALAMKVYGHLRNQHSTDMAKKVSFAVTEERPEPTPKA